MPGKHTLAGPAEAEIVALLEVIQDRRCRRVALVSYVAARSRDGQEAAAVQESGDKINATGAR